MKVATSPEGKRLGKILKRLVDRDNTSTTEVVRDACDMLERVERIAKRKGKTIKVAAQEALDLYEQAP